MQVYSFSNSYAVTRLDVEVSSGENAVVNSMTYDYLSRAVSGTENEDLVLKIGSTYVTPERNDRALRQTLEVPLDLKSKSDSISPPENRSVLIAKPWWRDYLMNRGIKSS